MVLFVGAVILVSNFGYGWYTDTVRVQAQYKAFTTEEIIADVGLHIGLRGINITLKGNTFILWVFNYDFKLKHQKIASKLGRYDYFLTNSTLTMERLK